MKRILSGLSLFTLLLLIASNAVTAQDSNTGSSIFATNTPHAPAADAPTIPVVTPTATAEPVEEAVTPVAPDEVQHQQVYEPEECEYVPGQSASDACIEIIEANPEPNVTDAPKDYYTLENYSFWRIGPDPIPAYDAPGGNPVRQIPAGFNFVNAVNETDGWIQNGSGEWINKADGYYVPASSFSGVLLPEGWDQPFGWILDTTGIWASTYPGGPATSESGLVPLHYEKYNIFAEAEDDEGWTWYMVGPNQWVKQIYMTVIKPVERPEGVTGRWVAIDLFEQSLIAYEDDQPVFATLISSGLPGTETNEGIFTVWARLAADGMSGATGAPNAYALEDVPWVMYFDEGISLHGTYWHDLFGYRRSRGCVNLSISDARWVFNFLNNAEPGPDGELTNYVYVFSSGEYRKSA